MLYNNFVDYTIILVALITAIPPTLTAYIAYKKLHVIINSRMTELLEATKGESMAKGKEEGKIEERAEVKERLQQ